MANTRIVLQKRDLAILLHIYNARVATNAEIASVFFTSTTLSSKRLSELVATGYILSAPYSFGSQRYAGKHYRLTQQGLDELNKHATMHHLPMRVARLTLSDKSIATALKVGAVRAALVRAGVIALRDWQFPRDVRESYDLPQFIPVFCRIRDIIVLHVLGGAFKYLASTAELANRLTSVACDNQPQINHVIIVYETRKESVRLLEKHVSGPVYMSTFTQLPALLTDLLTDKPAYHMNELISRYHALHPRATFGPPLLGTVEAMPNGLAYEAKVLLVDGITGSIFAKQEFLRAQKERRVELVRQGADLLLSSELPAPASAGKVLRATSKLG